MAGGRLRRERQELWLRIKRKRVLVKIIGEWGETQTGQGVAGALAAFFLRYLRRVWSTRMVCS